MITQDTTLDNGQDTSQDTAARIPKLGYHRKDTQPKLGYQQLPSNGTGKDTGRPPLIHKEGGKKRI